MALGTEDGHKLTRGHFGDSARFLVYELSEDGTRLVDERKNVPYEERPAKHGDPEKAEIIGRLLDGVQVLAGRRFGPNAKRMVHRFVCVRIQADTVDEALPLLTAALDRIRTALDCGPEDRLIVLKPGPPAR